MKILAATKCSYSTTYIAEFNSDELSTLVALSRYKRIHVTRADGKKLDLEKRELEAGDIVDHAELDAALNALETFLGEKDKILSGMATLRGAMTKLENSIPKEVVK